MEKVQNNLRYENKYVFQYSEYQELRRHLSFSGFKIKHRPNIINNIYFDHEYKSFYENIEGESNRKKIRLRWYGDSNNIINPKIEIKHKNGGLGYKKRFPLIGEFNLNNLDVITTELNKRIPKFQEKHLPVLVNRYKRDYFVNENLRITIDKNIYFMNSNSTKKIHFKYFVVEIKYSKDHNVSKSILANFNSTLSKNSKYVEGVKALKVFL